MKAKSLEEIQEMVAAKYSKDGKTPYKDWDAMIQHLHDTDSPTSRKRIKERWEQVAALTSLQVLIVLTSALKEHPAFKSEKEQAELQRKIDDASFRQFQILQQQ